MHRLLIAIALAVIASAQPPAKPLEFEVASIKPSDPATKGSSILTDRVGGLTVKNVPVKNLITMAYNIRDFQLSGGPGWIGTERYDIVAKPERNAEAPPDTDLSSMSDDQRKTRDEQWKERVRTLLATRFGLVIHKETKEQSVYVLSVAKGGSKLKVVTPVPGTNQGMRGDRGRAQGMAAPISMLVNNLSSAVGRPVLDKTGLAERYDFVLQWTPDVAAAENPDAAPADSGPTIFTALQEQLGLRLETAKGPVDTIVIDQIERPSAN